tara:strand:- start:685 stop:1707 length:1023 start_codon:yes stop_codon:yes gene_type:complete
MPKLIKILHPYEFENIKTINDFLVFSKNIFRLIKKKGCYEKKDGILIPLRWSKLKKTWVVDRGTNLKRDIDGIDLKNVDTFFNKEEKIYNAIVYILNAVESNKEFNSIANKFNLIKNDTKFIAFEYTNNITNIIDNKKETAYPIGLFEFCQTKARKGRISKNNSELIDRSEKVLKIVCDANKEKFSLLKKLSFEDNYTEVYNEFIRLFSKKNYSFISKDTEIVVSFENFINERSFKINNNFKIKDIVNKINNNSLSKEYFLRNKINIITLLLNVFLGEFVKDKLNLDNSEGVVLWENYSRKFIKLTGNFILESKKSFKVLNETKKEEYDLNSIPLLPKAF